MGFWTLVRKMDTKKMRATAAKVAKEAHRSTPAIFCDMVWCGFRYRAGYMDYDLFHFWDLNAAQRASVLTRGRTDQYVAALNRREDWVIFDRKPQFLERFAPFVQRKWLDLTDAGAEDLERFGRELGAFIIKPIDDSHGNGVDKIVSAEVTDWAALYERLRENGQLLCEEVIPQHEALNAVWPGSINTVRIDTILKDGKVHPVAACLRVGNGERPIDNFCSGGMVAPVDRKTGRVTGPAVDNQNRLYAYHPGTGTKFEGVQIPMWQAIMDLLRDAAPIVPTVRFVGWDIAVTPTGPVLVEGNPYPAHVLYGLPGQAVDKLGVLPNFDAVVPHQKLK